MKEATNAQNAVIDTNVTPAEQELSAWERWCVDRASDLNKSRIVHALFGGGDSINLAISLPKLAFDETHFHTHFSSAAELHQWLTSPLGISLSCGLVIFSVLGNYIDADKEDRSKLAFFADYWPYMRDVLKANKWVSKAVCNILLMVIPLYGDDIANLVIPLSITLGAIAAIERLWYRWMKEQRMLMEKENLKTLQRIYETGLCFYERSELSDADKFFGAFVFVNKTTLYYFDDQGARKEYKLKDASAFNVALESKYRQNSSDISAKTAQREFARSVRYDQLVELLDDHLESKIDWNIGLVLGKTEAAWEKDSKELKIEQQGFGLRSVCYFAKGLESLFNGMYFYSGAMIIVTYSPGAFALMVSISAGFLLSNLIAKIYEEYTFQNKLIITGLRVKLALSEKRLYSLYEEVIVNAKSQQQHSKELTDKLTAALNEYYQVYSELESSVSLSYGAAFCEGLQNGLSLQSATTGIMLCWFLFGFPATQATVIGFTAIGVASIFIHCLYALYQCSKQEINPHVEKQKSEFADLKNIVTRNSHQTLDQVEGKVEKLQKELVVWHDSVKSVPKLGIVEFEIGRVCLAGLKKGTKAGEEMDDLWGFLRTPEFEKWSYWGKIILTVSFAISFGARTLAKSYSSPPSKLPLSNSKESLSVTVEPSDTDNREQAVVTPFNNEQESSQYRGTSPTILPSRPSTFFKQPHKRVASSRSLSEDLNTIKNVA